MDQEKFCKCVGSEEPVNRIIRIKMSHEIIDCVQSGRVHALALGGCIPGSRQPHVHRKEQGVEEEESQKVPQLYITPSAETCSSSRITMSNRICLLRFLTSSLHPEFILGVKKLQKGWDPDHT